MFLSTAGWIAITLGITLTVRIGPQGLEWYFGRALAALSLLVAGAWAVRRGRQHLTPTLPSLALHDLLEGERIVLFLRSFKEDHLFARSPALWLNGQPTPLDLLTEEDEIGRAFAPFGKMIALGSTSDSLPRLGSERHYASDGTWKTEVRAALDRCTLVVLAVGAGGGLAWEVNELVARNRPGRLVLLVSRDRKLYDQFRNALGTVFPRGLPSYQGKRGRFHLPWSRYVRDAVWFDTDWTPYWERLRLVSAFSGRRRTMRALPRALWRLYYRAGVPLKVPSRVPRPWEVKMSVVLISHFWSGPALALIALAVGSVKYRDVTGMTNMLTSVLFVLFFLSLLSLYLYRVWQGGPVAITMTRVMSITIPLALMPIGLILFIGMNASIYFGLELPVTLVLTCFLWLASLVNMPMVFWLLLRRRTRDWVDSRL